jgi:uncharacterized membrane protein
MASLIIWLKYVHILAGFLFLLGHGTAVFVAFQLKKEDDPTRMKALLDVSGASWPTMMLSLLALLISGIITAFLAQAWGRGWVWASLVLLLALAIWMFTVGQRTYHPLRKMLGMPYLIQGKPQPAEKERPLEEIKAFVAKTRPKEVAVIGLGGFALILWMMIFKPF